MSGWSVVRWTGALGLAAIVVQLVGFIFGFAAGASADFNDPNKLLAFAKNSHFSDTTALFLFLIGFSLFIGFLAGLRAIAVEAAPEHEWLATTAFGAGLATTGIAFVALGLALAGYAIAVSSHADAAQVRLVYETSGVVGAPPGLVPMALFLAAAGSLG